MNYFLVFLFSLIASVTVGQGIQFNNAYGANGIDRGRNIAEGPDNNFYVVGSTSSSFTGNTDILVLSLDENGNQLWAQYYGTDQTDIGMDIIVTFDNNLLVLGYTNGLGAGGYDCYLLKMTFDGTVLWQKTLGGDDWDFAYDLEFSDNGNYYVLGETYSIGNGNNDAYLSMINNDGDIIWEKTYGTSGNEAGRNMTLADNGDLIIIGDQKLIDASSFSSWMLRLDSEGEEIWEYVHNVSDDVDEYGQDVIFHDGDFIALSNYPENVEPPYTSFWRMNNDHVIAWENTTVNQVLYGLLLKNNESFVLVGRDLMDNAQWFYWGLVDGFQDTGNGGPEAFDVNFGFESFYNGINTSDHGFVCVGEADVDSEGHYSVMVTKFDSLLITPMEVEIVGLPLAIEEINSINNASIFPNPVGHSFEVVHQNNPGRIDYIIHNVVGEKMVEDKLNDNTVNVGSLPNGTYTITLYNKGKLFSKNKFVVYK